VLKFMVLDISLIVLVTARNVCQILVAVAPCQVTSLRVSCLHYIFLNLEAVLRHGLVHVTTI
jgi:hypothetical protein